MEIENYVIYKTFNFRHVVLLKSSSIQIPKKSEDELADILRSKTYTKIQDRTEILKYYKETGNAKLPAIW